MDIRKLQIRLDKLAGQMSVEATNLNAYIEKYPSEKLAAVVNRLRAGNILNALDTLDEYLGD